MYDVIKFVKNKRGYTSAVIKSGIDHDEALSMLSDLKAESDADMYVIKESN